MTGKYAANVGLHTALIPGNPAGLDPKYTILPESLSKLGYKNCNYVFDYLSCYSPYEFMHFQFLKSCDLLNLDIDNLAVKSYIPHKSLLQ